MSAPRLLTLVPDQVQFVGEAYQIAREGIMPKAETRLRKGPSLPLTVDYQFTLYPRP